MNRGAPGHDGSLMVIYNLGFIALFAIFALLYRHALRQRDVLALDEVEVFEARHGLRVQLTSIAVGVLAVAVMIALWLIDDRTIGASGMVYMLMGPAHAIRGVRYGRAREKLIAARDAARL